MYLAMPSSHSRRSRWISLLRQIHAGTTVCSLNEKVAGQGNSLFGCLGSHGLVQQVQFGLPGGGEGFILCWVTGTVGIVNALGFV